VPGQRENFSLLYIKCYVCYPYFTSYPGRHVGTVDNRGHTEKSLYEFWLIRVYVADVCSCTNTDKSSSVRKVDTYKNTQTVREHGLESRCNPELVLAR
jgi:hypothetical protein